MKSTEHTNTRFQVFTAGDFGPIGYPKAFTKIKVRKAENKRRGATVPLLVQECQKLENPECFSPVQRVSIVLTPESNKRGDTWGLHKENWDIPNPDEQRVMAEVIIF